MDVFTAFEQDSALDFNRSRFRKFLPPETDRWKGGNGSAAASNPTNDDVITNNNNINSNRSDAEALSDFELEFHKVNNILNTYVLPVIILVGIVGNTVSFLVYIGTPRLYRQSSSLYLAFLAMVDNISLIFVFVTWFGWIGIHIVHKDGWCQTIHYCMYVCSFLSAWTVVSFTCERWIVVFHPLRRHKLCTRRRAIIVMTSLTLISTLFYSFSLFAMTVRHHSNGYQVCASKLTLSLQVLRSIDTMIVVVVPLVAIMTMNVAIGVKICRYTGRTKPSPSSSSAAQVDSVDEIFSNCSTVHQKYHMHNVAVLRSGGGCPAAAAPTPPRVTAVASATAPGAAAATTSVSLVTTGIKQWRILTRRQHTQVRITRALLIVSTVFVALNLPSYAFRIQAFAISVRNESDFYGVSTLSFIWQEFIQFLYYSNFSSRFFLYSACSRNFRYAVNRLACRRKRGRI